MARTRVSTIVVLAGCNGAGKSSIGGAALLRTGSDYFDPDVAARRIAAANPHRVVPLTQEEVNATAWNEGRRLLERAINERLDFAFETTLGGNTITELLERAAASGIAVNIWFVGLATVELHLERVRRRVAKGGHDIPEAKVRERYRRGRENLIRLLPRLAALRVFDNSADADPDRSVAPAPRLLLDCRRGRVVAPTRVGMLMAETPEWAKPIVTRALKVHLRS
ncbi:MAG: zeta toxin family protein [Casimicrobiaceae bacterium]